jgi:hypothetical protein
MKIWSCLLIVLTASVVASADDAPELFQLTATSQVVFADVQAGREILLADDDFSRRLSRFDLQSRLRTDKEVTRDDWRQSLAGEVTEWPPQEREKVTQTLATLKPKLEKFRLPLPKEILLIRTTGKEEADAAYTRGNAIILPAAKLRHQQPQLEALLTHELFHILSRNDITVRKALYKIIGYTIDDEVELPQSLEDRRITNPDAPRLDAYITLTSDTQTVTAVPILYATPKEYDASKGGGLFTYLTFRLLVVDKIDGKWQVRMKDNQPVVLDPTKIENFYDQVGRNTNYIWHPDEILADNFIHLVNGQRNLKTPRVTEAMAKVLSP